MMQEASLPCADEVAAMVAALAGCQLAGMGREPWVPESTAQASSESSSGDLPVQRVPAERWTDISPSSHALSPIEGLVNTFSVLSRVSRFFHALNPYPTSVYSLNPAMPLPDHPC